MIYRIANSTRAWYMHTYFYEESIDVFGIDQVFAQSERADNVHHQP